AVWSVERVEQVLLADDPLLLAVSVVGEGFDDVRACALEVDMEGPQGIGEFESHLGHEFTSGEIPALLEFEEEAFGADHRPGVEALGQCVGRGHGCSPIRWWGIVHGRVSARTSGIKPRSVKRWASQ